MSYGLSLVNNFDELLMTSGGILLRNNGPVPMIDAYPYFLSNPSTSYGVTGILNFSQGSGISHRRWGYSPFNSPSYGGDTIKNYDTGVTVFSSYASNAVIANNIQISSSGYSIKYNANSGNDMDYHYQPHAIPNTSDGNSEFFVGLPSEGLLAFGSWYNPYDYYWDSSCKGVFGWTFHHEDFTGQLTFITGTSVKPAKTGTHGIAVYDSAGNEIYDSRYESQIVRMKDHVLITKAQQIDCLQNGTTYNYTLRQPVNNPYIGGSAFAPWNGNTSKITSHCRLRMTSSTNLQMSRVRYTSNGLVPTVFQNKYYGTQDVVLLIADV